MWIEPVQQKEATRVAVIGVGAGLMTPLLALGISRLIIDPVFCHDGLGPTLCNSSDTTTYYVAAAVVAVIAVGVLAKLSVYRPLLIAVAAALALWGLPKYILPLANGSWLEYYTFSILLYTLAYLLFFWLLRISSFATSTVAVLAMVIIARLVLVV